MKARLSCLILVGLSFVVFAQHSILNSKSVEEFKEREDELRNLAETHDSLRNKESKPLEYGFVEPKDVIWSKTTWEVIDFNHRFNQPYYHTTPGVVSGKKSLYEALKDGIRTEQIREVYADEHFEDRMTFEQIEARMSKTDTSDYCYELIRAGEECTDADIDFIETGTEEIKMVKVKGIWYIDRRLGEMKYRLLGLCVMGPDAQSKGTRFDDGEGAYIELFWIYYPDARDFLANFKLFNPLNSSTSLSYDDVLNARRFASVIYKAENEYGTKPIADYVPEDAKGQMEEHHRIRNSILEAESDMWNY